MSIRHYGDVNIIRRLDAREGNFPGFLTFLERLKGKMNKAAARTESDHKMMLASTEPPHMRLLVPAKQNICCLTTTSEIF